jgi:hypothetical protein
MTCGYRIGSAVSFALMALIALACGPRHSPPVGVTGSPLPREANAPAPAASVEEVEESVHQPVEALAMPFASKKRGTATAEVEASGDEPTDSEPSESDAP